MRALPGARDRAELTAGFLRTAVDADERPAPPCLVVRGFTAAFLGFAIPRSREGDVFFLEEDFRAEEFFLEILFREAGLMNVPKNEIILSNRDPII